ncbi:MAG: class I SAM-dependent methyltransferase [Bryobacterales bacterium]
MNDEPADPPPSAEAILAATKAIGFTMASEPKTGSLLRTLAATKPAGQLLELGTGTGYATAWLLDGMDAASALTTVESEARFQGIAKKHLDEDDPRVHFVQTDAADYLSGAESSRFDLIFADTWAGKFTHLNEAIALLKPGGLYVIDDMLPQPSWPEDHGKKVALALEELAARADVLVTRLNWATGIILAVKTKSNS